MGIKEKYNDEQTFQHLVTNQGNEQLVSIKVGTLKVHPTDNEFFGITSSRQSVELHVVVVSSKVNMGDLVNFHDYSVLVQEIVATFSCAESLPLVQNAILPAFLGQTHHSLTSPAKAALP